jgi:cell wall-associated NlpC family hydrolase
VRPHLSRKFTLPTSRHHERVPASSSQKPPRLSSRKSPKLRLLARAVVPLLAVFMVIGLVAAPASANRRQDAMAWALRRIGCWYNYGGTGPCSRGFDCSGLVWAAYRHVGMRLPRTTYEMLHSSAIVPQRHHPRPGNLVFFGDGHVTLYYWRHVVLHAPQPGERVQLTRWYPGSSWVPTGYYRVRDAGAGPMLRIRRWVHRMMATRQLRIHQHTTLRDVAVGTNRPL